MFTPSSTNQDQLSFYSTFEEQLDHRHALYILAHHIRWQIFEDRLKSSLGHDANPWDPQDAFMASGMYLSDLGAVGTSQSAQNKAACSYYGTKGSSCSYSKSVMKLKSSIQANIDLL